PCWFTFTVTTGAAPEPDVSVPDGGLTLSQFPPLNEDASTVKGAEPDPALRIPNVWGGTTPPSATAVKDSPDCDSRSDSGFVLTVRVTGTVVGVDAVGVVMTTRPLYVPAGSPAEFAVTDNETGAAGVAVPSSALSASQLLCF